MALTPAQRILRAQIAAHTKWANTADPSAATAPARTAFLARFERQVDPEGILPPAERTRRAESAKSAHFARMAFKSAQSRARKKANAQPVAQPVTGTAQ